MIGEFSARKVRVCQRDVGRLGMQRLAAAQLVGLCKATLARLVLPRHRRRLTHGQHAVALNASIWPVRTDEKPAQKTYVFRLFNKKTFETLKVRILGLTTFSFYLLCDL